MAILKNIPIPSRKTMLLLFIYVIIILSLFMLFFLYIHVNLKYHIKKMKVEELKEYTRAVALEEKIQKTVNFFEERFFKPTKSTLSLDYLDIRSYSYLLNEPDKCKEKTPFLILLITTEAEDIEHREAIRKTWCNETNKAGVPIVCLFMLGINNIVNQTTILSESLKYHDIIQKDFQDTYKNLTIKSIMGMEWVTTYCPTAKYIMKTDSDMFVNIDRLLDLLQPDLPPKKDFFTGFVIRNDPPHRDTNSKWHMPYSLYPENRYPDFCSGTGYVFSTNLAAKILRSSFHIKYLYLEDVFVGLCLRKEGIAITSPKLNTLFNNFHVAFYKCRYLNLITSHQLTPREQTEYWRIIHDKSIPC